MEDFDGMFQRLYVAPGRHDITFKLDGYRTHVVKVYVMPDQTVKIRHEMISVNVRGRLGSSSGRLTLVLEPATVNGGWISLTRLEENRLAGIGTAQMSWEPQGPVELIRQPQGPAADARTRRSGSSDHLLPSPSAWNQV